MLYTRSPELTHLVTKSVYLWPTSPHFPYLQPLATPIPPSGAVSWTFLYSTYKWDRTVCLSVSAVFHVAQCPPGSYMLSQMATFPSFYDWLIFGAVYIQIDVDIDTDIVFSSSVHLWTQVASISGLLWITLQRTLVIILDETVVENLKTRVLCGAWKPIL